MANTLKKRIMIIVPITTERPHGKGFNFVAFFIAVPLMYVIRSLDELNDAQKHDNNISYVSGFYKKDQIHQHGCQINYNNSGGGRWQEISHDIETEDETGNYSNEQSKKNCSWSLTNLFSRFHPLLSTPSVILILFQLWEQ